MSVKATEVDTVLNVLGGKGLYQHVHHLLIVLCSFSAAFQLLDMIFIGRIIPHQCSAPPNGTGITIAEVELSSSNYTVEYGQCNIYIKYNTTSSINTEHKLPCIYGMTYTERKDASIVSEFDLVCERGALGDLPQTLLILGQAMGALVLPFFSDRYGRKSTNIISHVGVMVIGVATAFSNSYITFAILRLLMGIVQQGIVLTMATYAIEVYPTVYRRYVGVIGTFLWGICVIALTPFGYFLRMESWRTQQLAFCSVSLYVIIQIIFLDESFRWLIANGKYDIALKNIKKAAKWNKIDVNMVVEKFNELIGRQTVIIPEPEKGDQLLLNEDETKPIEKIEKYSLLDILKRKKLALNTVILWYLWCTAALSYFGLFFTSSSLAGDKYLNFFLNALMEFPPGLIFLLIIDRYGRKKTLATFYALCGTGMILATIIRVTSDSYAASICITILSLVGKLGAGGAFCTCFFYTPEIFPTNLRNVGLGSASIAARVGGMLGPFSRVLAQHISWGPGAIFGGCCLLATLLVTILPETRGKELPQTMADVKLLYKKVPDGSILKLKDGKTKIYQS
ncbi:organic cation transporter protein isoform X1 [Patella vulgata]|uniref:organic cation transporter protein isoform X1 n=2 Tax=Patella vulgata TaxID=6465 RepID=UPI0021805B15|nr:organic cation transporter protein isoform X1 [Patella vulgata]